MLNICAIFVLFWVGPSKLSEHVVMWTYMCGLLVSFRALWKPASSCFTLLQSRNESNQFISSGFSASRAPMRYTKQHPSEKKMNCSAKGVLCSQQCYQILSSMLKEHQQVVYNFEKKTLINLLECVHNLWYIF